MQFYDAVGIGIGAFNLSLAALLAPIKNFKCLFFDQKSVFNWHPGMLLDNAQLQVHFLKDLSSCVDPTSQYTFLNYLVENKRVYSFLNRKKSTVSRHEFNDYFRWAASRVPGLSFGEEVIGLGYGKEGFHVGTDKTSVISKNIVLGLGTKPYVPESFSAFIGERFFHSAEFKMMLNRINFEGKRVAVIGGGQSGAEVFDTLISLPNKPCHVTWVSKYLNFHALEDSCFANEFYTPHYVNFFYSLSSDLRGKKIKEQRLTSDGITQDFADALYNKLYELKYVKKDRMSFDLIPNHSMTDVKKSAGQYYLSLFDQDLKKMHVDRADIVILATGYKSNTLEQLKSILPESTNFSQLEINKDYSLRWQHEHNHKIYIQNGAKHTHGVADPNLSLSAWRNAVIINSMMGKTIYHTDSIEPILGGVEPAALSMLSAVV